jgi:hypothetical protein
LRRFYGQDEVASLQHELVLKLHSKATAFQKVLSSEL